jgi:hypothetical protein
LFPSYQRGNYEVYGNPQTDFVCGFLLYFGTVCDILELSPKKEKENLKYMSFNNSCSFAGIANLLAEKGIDTEDYKIALQMRLPYMMDKEGGRYLSGPMLQTKDWFNLFLEPLGYELDEKFLKKQDVISYIRSAAPAMIGVQIRSGVRHAVVYVGEDHGKMRFLNNKRKDSAEPDNYLWTEAEFLEKIGRDVTVIGCLVQVEKRLPDFSSRYERSLLVLSELQKDVNAVCKRAMDHGTLCNYQETLFRAVLLDNIAVLKLTPEVLLAEQFQKVQRQYLAAMRTTQETVVLAEYIDVRMLNEAIDGWRNAIQQSRQNEEVS